MFLIAGISSKIKPAGAVRAVCPACGVDACLHVIHKYMTPHVFFIPTVRFRSEYIATCGNCASVMGIARDKAKAFIKNADSALDPADMTVLQNNVRRICSICGARLYHGQKFCPNCGAENRE